MKSGLKFLTLNCWGLPFLTPQKNRRLDAIAASIRNSDWDVVALQEVWLQHDQERIIKNSGFPFHIVFRGTSRVFGSGLVLLSKFKILAQDFHEFIVRGFPHRVHEGDFHAAKGIGYALIETPIGPVPVFLTHLIAKYSKRDETDVNRVFRIAQILELIFYIRRKATPEGFVLCGDLNATIDDLEMETLFALGGIDRSQNPKLRSLKKRIDHIVCGATTGEKTFKIFSASLVFRTPFIHGVDEVIPYSDHEGMSVVVRASRGQADSRFTHRILDRTLRYMNFSLKAVRELDSWIMCLPVFGPLSARFMKPQFNYIDALLNMLEIDLKSAKSEHPLRLQEIARK